MLVSNHQLLIDVIVKVVMMTLIYSDNCRVSPFLIGLLPVPTSFTPTPSQPPDQGGRGGDGIGTGGLIGKIFPDSKVCVY